MMRRWTVIIVDMETEEHSLPERFFRHSSARQLTDRLNARFAFRSDEAPFLAVLIDERGERRARERSRLSHPSMQ